MSDARTYRLKLDRLDFISAVDDPAQETAKVVLIKRKPTEARVVKIADELGLVFCWAFTSKINGEDYHDLHGDAIDPDFIKAAAEFMERGGLTDEMHDGSPDGRVVFAMPMTPEIAKAFSVETDTTGLMVALKPSPEVLAKFKDGTYTGVSIAGWGERTPTAAVTNKSTQAATAPEGVIKMDPKDQEIEELKGKVAELEDELAKLAKMAKLSDVEREHVATLDADDAAAFLAKSADERTAIVKAAREVVYTCEDGTEILKSHGELMLRFAKQADDAVRIAKAEAAAREMVELKKRAAETLAGLPGSDEIHCELLKAAEKIGDEAIAVLKGASVAALAKSIPAGVAEPEAPVSADPLADWDREIAEAMKSKSVDRYAATAHVMKSEKGRALYAAYRKSLLKTK